MKVIFSIEIKVSWHLTPPSPWCPGAQGGGVYLEASLFFSFLDLGRAVKGSSLTGVRSLMTWFSLRSSLPICSSFLGLGVRSSTSVRRDFFTAYFPIGS